MRKTLEFEIFKDPIENKPTCTIGIMPSETCFFLGIGTKDAFCNFGGIRVVFRDNDGIGYIRPYENCPFWKDELNT